jgi:hypothetical protein
MRILVLGTLPLSLPAAAVEPPLPRPQAHGSGATEAQGPAPRPASAPPSSRVGGANGSEPATERAASPTGAVCGSPTIVGKRLAPLTEGPGCGIEEPVRVGSVAGIALEPEALLDCDAARALEEWLDGVAKPAFGEGESALAGLGVAASYVCRNVNYDEDGELSEHARGRAVDISRFARVDGTSIEVLDGWGSEAAGDLLRTVQDGACGIFTTVLGPESDEWHEDHFHLGVAERRRPYCP